MAQTKEDNVKSTDNDSKMTTATTGDERARVNGVPSNNVAVPTQVISRDEITKPEYTLIDEKLEIERGHPNYIFDNQRNQQAQENTVEVAAGTRNEDGTLNERHPQAQDANPSIVKERFSGTPEENRNRENLKK